MTNLQKSILVMIAHLGVVFILGWTDLGPENVLDLGPGVFVLVILSILSTLTIPFLRKASVYASFILWSVIYLGYRLLEPEPRPFIGGIDTYHTLIEIAILSISVYLAYEVSRHLYDVEKTITQVTIPDLGTRILEMRDAGREISTEFVRARRHNHPMAMVVIEPEEGSLAVGLSKVAQQIHQKMLERYMLASLAKVIGEEARRIDLVLKHEDDGRFTVLCPETDLEGSRRMVQRVSQAVRESLGVELKFGVATFPENALTFEDMLKKAEANLKEKPVDDLVKTNSI